MITATYSPPHPILFVFDFLNKKVEIPEYDPLSVVAVNDSCISIRTIADVDGDVMVELTNCISDKYSDKIEVFHGSIYVPNQKVSVVTSMNEKLLEAEISDTKANLRILVDDTKNPSIVCIELEQKIITRA